MITGWEYCSVTFSPSVSSKGIYVNYPHLRYKRYENMVYLDVLEQLGQEGWELVSVNCSVNNEWLLIMKRPK